MGMVELVAPAGGVEMFYAACEAGADAVYVGLKGFGDNSQGRGITVSELSSLSTLAASRNVKLHITLDSVVKEDELTGLIELVMAAVRLKPDVMVVQDLGMLHLIKSLAPTQVVQAGIRFAIHNTGGVESLRQLGADRVALIPQVHLNDIARIAAATKVDLEILVHGAIGYAIPGLALLSSYIDGNSVNRGRAMEMSRGSFKIGNRLDRPFATRDLDTLPILDRLVATGVTAIRIAGRDENVDDIAKTVRRYRDALNRLARGEQLQPAAGGKNGGAGSVGYYLGGQTDLLDPEVDQSDSIFIGTVHQMNQDTIGITPERPIRLGDRLEIRAARGDDSFSFTVKEIYLRQKRVRGSRSGELVRVGVPRIVRKGDVVYRLRAEGNRAADSGKVREILRGIEPRRLPLRLNPLWRDGKVEIATELEGQPFASEFTYHITPNATLSKKDLQDCFLPPSSSPFTLASFEGSPPANAMPNAWDVKSIATNFYRAAEAELVRRQQNLRREVETRLKRESPQVADPVAAPIVYRVLLPGLKALAEVPRDADVNCTIDFALRRLDGLLAFAEGGQLDAARFSLALPPWMWDGDAVQFRAAIEALVGKGIKNWVLGNIGQARLFADLRVSLSTATTVPCHNTAAFQMLRKLGLAFVSVSVEDDGDNWLRIADRTGGALEAPLYGHPALFISRSKPQDISERAPIEMENGPRLQLSRGESWTEVRSTDPVALTGHREALANKGIRRFVIDLAHEPWSIERYTIVMAAARQSIPLEGAGGFNFRRGLR